MKSSSSFPDKTHDMTSRMTILDLTDGSQNNFRVGVFETCCLYTAYSSFGKSHFHHREVALSKPRETRASLPPLPSRSLPFLSLSGV